MQSLRSSIPNVLELIHSNDGRQQTDAFEAIKAENKCETFIALLLWLSSIHLKNSLLAGEKLFSTHYQRFNLYRVLEIEYHYLGGDNQFHLCLMLNVGEKDEWEIIQQVEYCPIDQLEQQWDQTFGAIRRERDKITKQLHKKGIREMSIPREENWGEPFELVYDSKYIQLNGIDTTYGNDFDTTLHGCVLEVRNARPSIKQVTDQEIIIEY